MKKLTFTLSFVIAVAISAIAQQSKTFKYQAVGRSNTGDIIADQPISIRTSIIQDSINGTLTYSETHSITTNPFGMIVLEIGNGTVEMGVFEDIAWGTTSHFLQLEMDETGGTNYQFMGTSELLSVPYSMNSGSVTLTSPEGGTYEVEVDNSGNLIANCFPQASIAEAGADTVHATSPVSLAANTPDSDTGVWTIIRGTGGIIADPNNPTSTFSG